MTAAEVGGDCILKANERSGRARDWIQVSDFCKSQWDLQSCPAGTSSIDWQEERTGERGGSSNGLEEEKHKMQNATAQ
ncbi:hypothetical protein EMPG_12226 [Blastomyces silverae]|uniref:Uncharacterized protein n=1 Tax=Blastomyces silverae TaxID=2060906 RepID=A0A0H1BUN4_9EURO|nr:hypothetical protein EMPG_12226 [Blastomyces silverae]